jgi:DNA-binding MarR family transcriptional regulator
MRCHTVPSQPRGRAEIVDAVIDQGRLGAMRSALFHAAVASRAGLNMTDVNCLGILDKEGPLTPSDLSRWMGLTRGGAVTAMVDRLEKAGYVRRERNSRDRRQVMVELVREGPYREMQNILADVNDSYRELVEQYSSTELAAIHSFSSRANELLDTQTRRLHAR